MGREGIQIYDIGVSARHALWTPRNIDGSSPARGGTGVPVANGWQPFAVGDGTFRDGDAQDFIDFKSDSGLKIALSGYTTTYPTEDRKGDGDSVVQRRFTGMEDPQGRTMSLLIPRLYEGIAQFFRTVKLDHPRHGGQGRPFDLREIYYAIASADALINLAGGYDVGDTVLAIDGPGADDIEVGNLVEIDPAAAGVATLRYLVVARTTDTITVEPALITDLADDDPVERSAIDRQRVQSFLLEGWNETREPGGTLMAEAALTPYGAATETGV